MKFKGALFLSNGHGEDAINCQILSALRASGSNVDVAAMPIVGDGAAYARSGVRMIGPTSKMPSGGVFYMNPIFLVKDIGAGLIALTWQQLRAVWRHSPHCDLVVATGDIVVAAIAHLTDRPYIIFLSAHSSYYEGRVNLGFILPRLLSSPKCLTVFTRDALTAADLNRQGLKKAKFVGNPVMDNLHSTAQDLQLIPEVPTIALLPGSRLPEANNNLILLLQLVKEIVTLGSQPLQFLAALVPSLMPELDKIALRYGWENHSGKLIFPDIKPNYPHKLGVEVLCYSDAFADILQHANLVIGMTGTAVEQSVGLGKPVISVSGNGPSFTYRFAEAQHRLLGESVQVFGKQPANHEVLKEAALGVYRTLQDEAYLARCAKNGLERMGRSGASIKIADFVVNNLRS